jgi:hypothetical protein
MPAKEIRVRCFEEPNQVMMQCLEIPDIKATESNYGQARASIIQQLQDHSDKRNLPMKLTMIRSEETDVNPAQNP